jgi:Histidine kinase-, DNA gyrase B-, and HSP90-like ATPase
MTDLNRRESLRLRLVSEANFVQATRDAGYKDVASALGELIDNAIQANATRVEVFVMEQRDPRGQRVVNIGVLDNGSGMDAHGLHRSLQFGGTRRFGDRSGFGRFGMGLPNSSLSQAPRVDVFAWQLRGECLHTYLDVEEVASGKRITIPRPTAAPLPSWASDVAAASGVLVLWSGCDRLKHRKASTVASWVRKALGRMYYYPLSDRLSLAVNGCPVEPIDPLLRIAAGIDGGAVPFGEPLRYEVALPQGNGSSFVEVRFTELPVRQWASLPNETKRMLGIVGGAGASILRLDREIDNGWLLMGGKRKENYDDWWRCEIRFLPALDELFGVNHTKQGIRPSPELKAILEPELEAVARLLNARVRSAFQEAKAARPSRAVLSAWQQDRFLPPVANGIARPITSMEGSRYRIEICPFETRELFRVRSEADTIVLALNERHPFYRRIYNDGHSRDDERYRLECVLLSAARASLSVRSAGHAAADYEFRSLWGDALAAFLS